MSKPEAEKQETEKNAGGEPATEDVPAVKDAAAEEGPAVEDAAATADETAEERDFVRVLGETRGDDATQALLALAKQPKDEGEDLPHQNPTHRLAFVR